ncbi:MAG: hypothetical protein QOF02_350 [Blastocatellia bacterium]|jgi:tetratricopeptide (TPR) repeat protein|nr:hypothetical protein [Blastocatellia bacterium]
MKRSSSLLFIALFLFASSTWAQTSGPAKELADSCIAKYKQNDFDGALADCSKALELNPRSTDAYAMRGVLFLQKGNLEGALADLDKALGLDPRNAHLYGVRGMAKLKKGDFVDALADYDKVIEIEPSLANYKYRAIANYSAGNFDKAIDDLNVVARKASGQVDVYTLRALAKFRKSDWAGAIADYDRAIKFKAYGDQVILNSARSYITSATPIIAEFTKRGLAPSFLTTMGTTITAVKDAIAAQAEALGEQTAATAGVAAAQQQLVDAVHEFGPIVLNTFSNDPSALAAWKSASHVERAPKKAAKKKTSS